MVVSNIFYVHPYLGKRFPFWRAYFSNGLVQPPTSYYPRYFILGAHPLSKGCSFLTFAPVSLPGFVRHVFVREKPRGWSGGHFLFRTKHQAGKKIWWSITTLPEVEQFPPENGWLGDDCFLVGWQTFRGYVIVLGKLGKVREGTLFNTSFLNCGFVVEGREIVMFIYTYLSKKEQSDPRCSMYGLFPYIWVVLGLNVGKYTIHWAFGDWCFPKLGGFSWFSMCQWEAPSIAKQHEECADASVENLTCTPKTVPQTHVANQTRLEVIDFFFKCWGTCLMMIKPYYNKWWFVNQPIKKMLVGLPGKTTLQCTMFFAMFFLKKQDNDICMNLIGMIILIHINTLMN